MSHPRTVIVHVESGGPARRGPAPTEDLRRELERLGEVRAGAAGVPQTRAIDFAGLGQIVVTVSGVAGGLVPVVEAVRGWLRARAESRTARLEIDGDVLVVTGLDSDEQQTLIDRWLERHEAKA